MIASTTEGLSGCQEKLNNYLKRCVTSSKLLNSTGIFQYCDQYTINTFYKYCQDRCVLAKVDPTGKELELIGFISSVLEIKEKWQIMFHLAKEKALYASETPRPSSATIRSARIDERAVTEQTKVYNIMLSYCQADIRNCQHMLTRFDQEGLSVWAEPGIGEHQRDVLSQIDKSDCIILCVSENYYENLSAEKEARYTLQTGKPTFLVKIQNDPLLGWQREVFEGNVFYQLFGSKNHFDLNFDKLMLEIVRTRIWLILYVVGSSFLL